MGETTQWIGRREDVIMKHIDEHRVTEVVKTKKSSNQLWLIGALGILALPTVVFATILTKSVQALQNNGSCISLLIEGESDSHCVKEIGGAPHSLSSHILTTDLSNKIIRVQNSNTQKIEELNKRNVELVTQIRFSVINSLLALTLSLIVSAIMLKYRFKLYDNAQTMLLTEAHTDNLTNLSNRRRFLIDLEGRMVCAEKHSAFFTVIFIDVDRFKHINDTYGHSVGDEVLQSLADILRTNTRTGCDSLGRLAGDEFAIATSCFNKRDASIHAAVEINTRIRHDIKKLRKKEAIDLSVSIGVAIYPDDGTTEKELLTAADTAMYDAKQKGRAVPYVFYDKELHDEERRMEYEIQEAIDKNRCYVEYQPKINLRTNVCVGVEALIRIIDSRGNVITPTAFIPVAERIKKMGAITKRLIDIVAENLEALGDLTVSLNISPNQLRDRYIVHYLQKKIEEKSIQDGRLEIEITEQAEIQDVENMRSLGVLPITISIDDFGKGYNSLACMYKFREYVDTIKIDKEFSDNIMNDQGYAVFKTIVGLARQFKYNIVVEGVETQEQITRIAALDCDVIQGFFYCKPMRLAAVLEYIGQLDAKTTESNYVTP
jgi:diguanylate cyclase (GGDEF)-like protein